jgi:hypothetical protein
MNPTKTNPNEYRVVTFKNITSADFTPALGAMFNSKHFLIKAGESMNLPFDVGHRLAINLAKAIIIGAAPAPKYGEGNDTQASSLIKEGDIEKLVEQILVKEYQEEASAVMTAEEKLSARIDELNKKLESVVDTKIGTEGYSDKKEVIEALKAKGVTYNPRKSKEELEALLQE